MGKCRIVTLLIACGMAFSQFLASASGLNLHQYQLEDGRKEIYYAVGDPFLVKSFELLDTYWTDIATNSPYLVRGHIDAYLPIDLNELDHKPAKAMMTYLGDYLLNSRTARGLIPYSYPVDNNSSQPAYMIVKATEFLQWRQDDATFRQKVIDFADATKLYFDPRYNPVVGPVGGALGVYARINPYTGLPTYTGGNPEGAMALLVGGAIEGMTAVSQITGQTRFSDWAAEKSDFIWNNRWPTSDPLFSNQPVLADWFTIYGPQPADAGRSDTDTIYYVRQLFHTYQQTGTAAYRDRAMAVTDFWYTNAWKSTWGHFIRKLWPNGTAADDRLYGDGPYNTLWMLGHAYEVTQTASYLDRFKTAWNNLVQMGQVGGLNGFFPAIVQQGAMVISQGRDPEQTQFLPPLIYAWKVSNDAQLKTLATDFGNLVLAAGPSYWRIESGQTGTVFLQLARMINPIHRLEFRFGRMSGVTMTVVRNSEQLLSTTVNGEVAVVYLPQGQYSFTFAYQGQSISRSYNVQANAVYDIPIEPSVAAEWQFNGNTDLTTVASGASTSSQLVGPATYNDGSTGLAGWKPFLQTGYLNCPNGVSGPAAGLKTANTVPSGDSNAQYRDYFGREGIGFAGGTFYGVYQPTGWAWDFGNYRHTIAIIGSEASALGDIWIYFNDNYPYNSTEGVRTSLSVRNSLGSKSITTSTPALVLDGSKWYFLAASWADGIDPSIYIREMNPAGPASSPAGTSGSPFLVNWNYPILPGPQQEPLVLGTRYNYDNFVSENANGKLAWAQFTDTYTDPSQYDAVFAGLENDSYVTVQGTANLGGYSGDKRDVQVKVELRKGGQVSTYYRQLDTNGQFTISNVLTGTYDVAVKSYAHLQRVKTVVISSGSVNLGSFDLVGGNANGDSAIGVIDLSTVLTNLDRTSDN